MEKTKGLSDWIPLIGKLVWPIFIMLGLLIFHNQVRDIYGIVKKGVESGRSVEFGGFLKLGTAASNTKIETLSHAELSIKGVGGAGGVARKGSVSQLQALHVDSIPVVDADQRWLFFANRGEILARLMTAIIVDEEIPET